MNRIDFLKQLLAGVSSIFLSGSHIEKKAAAKREIRLTSRYVAGFQYYRGAEIENKLKVNDSLLLKREPKNKYDCYAVEVYHGDNKLGYLPREENRVVARMMDQEINVKGRITKINSDSSDYRKVKMKVFYEEG
jgi:hypothetical protein